MSEFSLRSQSGKDPETLILQFKNAIQPTEGDLLAAGLSQRTRILARTAAHVDVDGNPFAPYSENGPYYYRPWDRPGLGKKGERISARRAKLANASRVDSTKRLFRKIGGRKGQISDGGKVTGTMGKGSDSIRFDSYAAFKRAMGRGGVDLTGPRAPHMMQAIEVKAGSSTVSGSSTTGSGSSTPASQLVLGIYGEKAKIASGHNAGDNPGLPKRRFFGSSGEDAKKMLAEILTHIKLRLNLI